jgi:hypothetical protein
MASSTIRKLANHEVGELYRHYPPLQGKDPSADLVLALIRKLVHDQAMAIPYGDWVDRLSHPLRVYGISREEWNGD